MELYAVNLHFLGDNERERKCDLCVHGDVSLKLNGQVLFCDTDTCVSASVHRFLHSLFADHISGNEEQMFPCCGHMMIPSEDSASVTIIGCPYGVDFDVIHDGGSVILKGEDGRSHPIPYDKYRSAVLAYAAVIADFYRKSPPRHFTSEFDREGFSAFTSECRRLIAHAEEHQNC